ncbi:hypothetical protein F0562_021116 [Nyssa sinensis]|uniref:Plastocyanin-like domain-containing protein n=1 Tax=Nyssa sinensis TaxID=561372 RepID=A0A5J5BKN2_9ASTE|nr:hypothetical protein F0562_021116 [Nyssa sinensis]
MSLERHRSDPIHDRDDFADYLLGETIYRLLLVQNIKRGIAKLTQLSHSEPQDDFGRSRGNTYTPNYRFFDVHVGQSYSVLLTADQPGQDYYITVSSRFTTPVLTTTSILHFSNSAGPVISLPLVAAFAIRFFTGPTVMATSFIAIGLRGGLHRVDMVQWTTQRARLYVACLIIYLVISSAVHSMSRGALFLLTFSIINKISILQRYSSLRNDASTNMTSLAHTSSEDLIMKTIVYKLRHIMANIALTELCKNHRIGTAGNLSSRLTRKI